MNTKEKIVIFLVLKHLLVNVFYWSKLQSSSITSNFCGFNPNKS